MSFGKTLGCTGHLDGFIHTSSESTKVLTGCLIIAANALMNGSLSIVAVIQVSCCQTEDTFL
jgi:hypothetical protein